MDKLIIAGREFTSRLLVGTGKFASCEIMADAIEKSGTEIVTVALRRVDIQNQNDDMLRAIDPDKYLLLPNTSGARDAEEAVRLGYQFGLRYLLTDVYFILMAAVTYTVFTVLFTKYKQRWFLKFKDVSFVILMMLIVRLFVQMLVVG